MPSIVQQSVASTAPKQSAAADNSVSCAICGPNATSVPFAESNGIPIVQCESCGLYHVTRHASETDVSAFYRDHYIADTQRAEVELDSYRTGSLSREAGHIRSLLPHGGRLLDCGAASGRFLREFDGRDEWSVAGVEPSAFAVQYARQNFGLEMYEGFLHDQKFGNESFDVITSLDTFMLHPNANEDLQEMFRILKPGGFLAMEIPGLRFRFLKNHGFVCRLLYGVPTSLNAGVHLNYFNRETLSRLCGRHNFELVRSWPEQMPEYGNVIARVAKSIYFGLTATAYSLTGGRCHFAPKEFLVFRKVEAGKTP